MVEGADDSYIGLIADRGGVQESTEDVAADEPIPLTIFAVPPECHKQERADGEAKGKSKCETTVARPALILRYTLWVLSGIPPHTYDNSNRRDQNSSTDDNTSNESPPILEATPADEEQTHNVHITYAMKNVERQANEVDEQPMPCWKRYERSAWVARIFVIALLIVSLSISMTNKQQKNQAVALNEPTFSPTAWPTYLPTNSPIGLGGNDTQQSSVLTYSPSNSPVTNNEATGSEHSCIDTPGYVDRYGGTCKDYEAAGNYPSWCSAYGSDGESGMTPNENCCACNELIATCKDTTGYFDIYGDSCKDYESAANYPSWCTDNGSDGESGMTPNENCCVCKKLITAVAQQLVPPSESPTLHPSPPPTTQQPMQSTLSPSRQPTLRPIETVSFSIGTPPAVQQLSPPSKQPTSRPIESVSFNIGPPPTVSFSIGPPPTVQQSSPPSKRPTLRPSILPATALPSFQTTEESTAKSTSNAPTDIPTVSPSGRPSLPSVQQSQTPPPTAKPTDFPSSKPVSSSPTAKPAEMIITRPPIARPPITAKPTPYPTYQPTAIGADPTTRRPTKIPTPRPRRTSKPTTTRKPSINPTNRPTQRPSSKKPTVVVSRPGKTESPTEWPTYSPTVWPTYLPTISPIVPPTLSPSKKPSLPPTPPPSSQPTDQPSPSPTNKKLESPTLPPSSQPITNLPSASPNKTPTGSPTLPPSTEQTNPPSASSSTGPTRNTTVSTDPTALPTTLPTSPPS